MMAECDFPRPQRCNFYCRAIRLEASRPPTRPHLIGIFPMPTCSVQNSSIREQDGTGRTGPSGTGHEIHRIGVNAGPDTYVSCFSDSVNLIRYGHLATTIAQMDCRNCLPRQPAPRRESPHSSTHGSNITEPSPRLIDDKYLKNGLAWRPVGQRQ